MRKRRDQREKRRGEGREPKADDRLDLVKEEISEKSGGVDGGRLLR
jgi:hypothetical protein